jgi:site-specific DNA-methyltransferase (adenine-specific)
MGKIQSITDCMRHDVLVYHNRQQQGNKRLNEVRIHPSQKPVAVYAELLKRFAKPGFKILDTHLGSGSSRIACYELGFDFYGCELDADIFNDQEQRFRGHAGQNRLFDVKQLSQ